MRGVAERYKASKFSNLKQIHSSISSSHFKMPKAASCSFSICANGLKSSDRENFKPLEEAHWRSCHVDEPVKFTCPYTEHDVELRRNPQKRYLFVCVCGKSRLLNSGSVKRHYTTCSTVRRQVVEARTSQSTSGPSDDPRPISEPDSFIRDSSPTASSVSGVVPYNDSKYIALAFIL